jgi:DNA-binding IclR family transcriptional regulator
VRRTGYAVNREDTEPGITAIGAAVHEPGGRAVAALTVSAPTLRLPRSQVEKDAGVLTAAARSMSEAL